MTTTPRRRLHGLGALALAASIAAPACGGGAPAPAAAPPAADAPGGRIRVHVSATRSFWSTLTIVAARERYFEKEGLEVDLSYETAGRYSLEALFRGAADIADVSETDLAYRALSGERNLLVFGRIASSSDFGIVTKVAPPIQRPADLAGKRIAYGEATGGESYLLWLLEREKIPVGSVTLVPLQPDLEMVVRFLRRPADAIVAGEPLVSSIRARSYNLGAMLQAGSGAFEGATFAAARRDWAQAHRRTLDAYDRALRRAAADLAADPWAAQRLLLEETDLPREAFDAAWPRYDYTYGPPADANAALVDEVAGRIRRDVPAMKGKTGVPATSFFDRAGAGGDISR
jgi:NitT/TauT family transport system substrate-binding protein